MCPDVADDNFQSFYTPLLVLCHKTEKTLLSRDNFKLISGIAAENIGPEFWTIRVIY
jgi:hypothetical protein